MSSLGSELGRGWPTAAGTHSLGDLEVERGGVIRRLVLTGPPGGA